MARRRSRTLLAVAALLVAAAGVAGLLVVPGPAAAAGGPPPYYVALGDSLSRGFQPVPGHLRPGAVTDRGYPDLLDARLPAPGGRRLTLVKLGCPGETTATMAAGGICRWAERSQLAAAVAFLAAHRGGVRLVTLDIGVNDVVRCEAAPPGPASAGCLDRGLAAVRRHLPAELAALRSVAPGVPLVGLDYYDPYAVAGPAQAAWSEQVTSRLNGALAAVYRAAAVPVADVAAAFAPADVCRLTWMCAGPGVGPNLHADDAGYAAMAAAVEPVAARLLVGQARIPG